MTEEILDTEIIVTPDEPRSLRYIEDDRGIRHLLLGQKAIATCGDDQVAIMARIVMRMPARMNTLAWIGAGFCIGPRLTRGRMPVGSKPDIYELRQRLVDKLAVIYPVLYPTWNFIVGDWHNTLTGLYQVIVYDAGDLTDSDRALLQSHLEPGGLLLGAD